MNVEANKEFILRYFTALNRAKSPGLMVKFALLFVVLLLVAGCVPISPPLLPAAPSEPLAAMQDNKVLLLPRETSSNMELMITKEVGVMVSMLEKAGFKVVVATPSGKPLVGSNTTLAAEMKLADVNVDDYVGFILPCMAAGNWGITPDVVAVVQKAVATGRPVAAQRTAREILRAAGALEGKQFAIGSGVVQDGNLITSGISPYAATTTVPDDTVELTQEFIAALASSH